MTVTPHAFGDSGFGRVDVPADATNAHDFRRQFTHWIADTLDTNEERRSDIVLAVYEAVANASEHAYDAEAPDATVTVQAQYRHSARTLDVTVVDHGTWKEPTSPGLRGRGIPVINALSDSADITTGPAPSGTTATLQWRLFS